MNWVPEIGSITEYLDVPSGKHTKNYGKSPCYQWVNPLFRLGHVQVRKLSTYQRALFFLVELQRSQTFKRNGAFDRNVSNRSHDWFYLSVDVFLNEAFQSFVDLDVFCELPSICCILLFWGGTTLDPGRIFPFLSLESPQAL